jgi:hypothetical protein
MNERDFAFDERAPAVFEPDALLASQYFDRVRRSAEHEGERRLMVAVLEDGVRTYTRFAAARDPHGRELFLEAEAWIEDRDASWFYSFENVCNVLGLEADWLRRGLRVWRAGGSERASGTRVVAMPVEEDAEELREASGA